MPISEVGVNAPIQPETGEAEPIAIPSRYESAVQVGAGGMGIVYKARDKETGDIVALKVLRADVAADPKMQENLRKEVRLARKVTHKNVCRIHEFNRSEGHTYISMEFVEGKSLQVWLQQNGRLPWNEVVKIAKQICAGLGEAHAQGIVHRDLKPANIMIDASGAAKIMDFGIARPAQVAVQMTSTMIGTPAYMAPEQVSGRGVDGRTDIYAVGLLLYSMVTSSEAFEGDAPLAVALKQLREYPTPAREVVPGLSAQAEAIIVRCIQKDPAKRFQSMDELAAALTDAPQVMVKTQEMLKTQPLMQTQAPAQTQELLKTQSLEKTQALAKAPARNIGLELEKLGVAAYRGVLAGVNDVRGRLSQSNWEVLQSKKKQRILVAGLAGVCLVGGIVFAVPRMIRKNNSLRMDSSAGLAANSAQEAKTIALVPADVRNLAAAIQTREPSLPAEAIVPDISEKTVGTDKLKVERKSGKDSPMNIGSAKMTGSSNLS